MICPFQRKAQGAEMQLKVQSQTRISKWRELTGGKERLF
jgi:hypothetical protein